MWAHGMGMEPQEGTEAKEGKLGYVCTSLAIMGRQIWWSFSHCLSCLFIRLAAVVLMPMCLPPGQRNEGGVGGRGEGCLCLQAWERYSHKLKGWQLIKNPRLQTREDVSRYVSAGGREQSDRILGSSASAEGGVSEEHAGTYKRLGPSSFNPLSGMGLPSLLSPHSQSEKPGEA